MVGSKATGLLTIFVFLLGVKSIVSLRCWSCSSDMDLNCRDHFNATNFQYRFQNPVAVNYETGIRPATTPYLQECPEGGNIYLSDQKAVCVKKKQSYTSSSQQVVIRQCATVPRNTRPGTCSHETTGSSISIDFCEYCDYDGCNGATGLQKGLLAVLIPALLLLFLRK